MTAAGGLQRLRTHLGSVRFSCGSSSPRGGGPEEKQTLEGAGKDAEEFCRRAPSPELRLPELSLGEGRPFSRDPPPRSA